jgi:undecaprenyl pyrophosphate phosphatase UppP
MIPGWLLPLFAAEPKLGPIYGSIDHMVPMQFPLLLVVPAIVIDLLMQRAGKDDASTARDWALAPAYGAAFLAAFFVAQWPFADFLHSPASRNWFFFTNEFGYMVPTGSRAREFKYYDAQTLTTPALWTGLALGLVYAMISARAGLAWGRWMRFVRR